jgi:transcriptional regulator with XRE-family HTH domain
VTGNEFVKNIETRLIQHGISKELFYEKSGVSTATMSQWRNDLYTPSKRMISRVDEFFAEYAPEKEKSSAPSSAELSDRKKLLIEKIKLLDESVIPHIDAIADQILFQREK